MDGNRFDDTTRSMIRNRRGVLTGSAALALAGALSALPRSLAAAKKKPKKKKKPASEPKSAYTCVTSDATDFVQANLISRYAQSFSATRSGTLREIRVLIDKQQEASDYEVQLVRMAGTVPSHQPFDVIAAAVIPNDAVPIGNATLSARFGATSLVKDEQYAVVVSRFGSGLASEMAIPVPFSGDPCEGGMAIADAGGAFTNLTDPVRDMTVTVLVD
jgi:hypothetical protein